MTRATNPTKDRNRQNAQQRGHWAEYFAAVFLIVTGHRILAMRYKCRSGEIDIIAKKSGLIIMAEVKARKTVAQCVDAVTQENMRRIHSAADIWLSRQRGGENMSVRFDIIAITPWRFPKHLKNAF